MVRFIEGPSKEEEESSKWKNLMRKTRERFREIWSGGEKIPDRE